MHVTVLGPQRRPTLDQVVRSLGLADGFATVTAGWTERERDDGELNGLLGGRAVNLSLYARWLDVQERDEEFAVAEKEHGAVLDELRQLYLLQLDSALKAGYAVAARGPDRPRARAAALADARAVVRLVDEHHLARVRAADSNFYQAWQPQTRPVIAEHREQVRRILAGSGTLVVAGGHVGVLVRVLHLFHLGPHLPGNVVAWSAGAMALTERVVLFHDDEVQGFAHAEVYAEGLGLLATVLLPHARRRLRLDDASRMSMLAHRFAPARCVLLDDGVRLDMGAGGATLPAGARVVTVDGGVAVAA